MRIWKECAGVISEDSVWCCYISGGYLYTADTFLQLLKMLFLQWKKDKHLVG